MSSETYSAAKRRISVSEVMSQNYEWVESTDTVYSAINTMIQKNIPILIVSKRDEDDEFGIVVVADIAKKVLAVDRSPERVNVYEIMSKPVVSIPSGMDIRYCARLFDQLGLNVAPVYDKNHSTIVGVISYKDIVLKGLAAIFSDSGQKNDTN